MARFQRIQSMVTVMQR